MKIRWLVILAAFILVGVFVHGQEEVIGIISRIQGGLVHELGGKETELKRTDEITRDSVIRLAAGEKRALVEILTASGPQRFSRFPIEGFTRLAGISQDMQDQYRTALGGKVLGTRGRLQNDPVTDIFAWSMALGALDAREVDGDLYLVLSRTESSRSSLSFTPVAFPLRDGVSITEARYIIIDKGLNLVEQEGRYERRGDDWIFRFDSFDYLSDVTYEVKSLFTLEDGEEALWSFTYKIYGKDDMEFIEEDVEYSLTGKENAFQEAIVRAAVYQSYNMKLEAIRILSGIGVDVEELLE